MSFADHVVKGRRTRSKQGEGIAPAVMRGRVVAVEGTRVYVALPDVSVLEMHGPVSVAAGVVVAVDNRVLVAAVRGSFNDLVVFAVL